ncbi:hypothetical protein V5O48_006375 [Marasmius crinis-equi]|uniref:Shelterin complex subunit TPP1/Est3 domain-containing protein n=1 Tax=Marasmius crinis-equi TaxID=585013 RepID=A0ABR3FK19_9AGAR
MSKSTSPRWVADYLIEVAQEYGGDASLFPDCTKKKKVQVIGFLSFGSRNLDEDTILWALVSDKTHYIPVRFSQEAVAQYRRDNGERFTAHKTSIITLAKYRVILTRAPKGSGQPGLSEEAKLVLDCTEFSLIGSCGEDVWGTPRAVEKDVSEIREWETGLRKGGGDGNILRDRKRNAEQNGREKHVKILLPEGHGSPQPQPKPRMSSRNESSSTSREISWKAKGKQKEIVVEDTFARRRQRHWTRYARYTEEHSMRPEGWKEIVKGLSIYGEEDEPDTEVMPPPKKKRAMSHPLDIGSTQPSQPLAGAAPVEEPGKDGTEPAPQTHPDDSAGSWPSQQATPPPSDNDPQRLGIVRDRSSTPIGEAEWPPTDHEEEQEQEEAPVLDSSPMERRSSHSPSSPARPFSVSIPTPAQRKRVAFTPSQKENLNVVVEEPELPLVSSPEMPKTHNSDDLQRSSLSPVKSSPLVSQVTATQTMNYLSSSLDLGMNVRRRVPPPRQPEDIPKSGRVLAPPSDTSGSQGQSQSQTQGREEEEEKSNEGRTEDRQGTTLQHSSRFGLPEPARTTAKTRAHDDYIIPETQSQPVVFQTATRDKDDGDRDTRSEGCSLDVHPGTAALPDMDTEDEREGDRDYQRERLKFDRVHRATEISQGYPEKPGEAGHEADDEQTLASLFSGTKRNHDPADWVEPSFLSSSEMGNSKAHHGHIKGTEQTHNGTATSSKRRIESFKSHRNGTAMHKTQRDRDSNTLTAKGKKRARGDASDDDDDFGHTEGRVKKKFKRTEVEHDADPARGFLNNSTGGASRSKLNGFSLGLDDMKCEKSWMMNWERLGRILLKTGRERVQRLKDAT